MPRIVSPYNTSVGAVISVVISDPVSDRPEHESPKSETVTMLIDSGASDSAISGKIASRLSLPVLGYHGVVGFGSHRATIQYLADIDLCLDTNHSLSGQLLLNFDYGNETVQGLLGRDIIGLGRFTMNGLAKEFSFEID